jgi:hypothetical protein
VRAALPRAEERATGQLRPGSVATTLAMSGTLPFARGPEAHRNLPRCLLPPNDLAQNRRRRELLSVRGSQVSRDQTGIGSLCQPRSRAGEDDMNPVEKSLSFIENRLAGEISSQEIARAAGVSNHYLARAFGAATGHSLMR